LRFRDRLSYLALTLAIATALWQPRPAAQAPPPLFEDGGAALRQAQAGGAAAGDVRVLRSREVRLIASRLRAAVADGQSGARGPLFTLNLFDDTSLPAVFERYETDVLGHETWVGRVAGDSLSTVTLTWNGDTVVGGVQAGDAIYRLSGTMAAAVVEQVDPATFGHEFEPVPVPPGEIATSALDSGLARPMAGETADILVFYTTAARNAQGGQAAIEALIATAVADANTAYARSGLIATLRLAGAAEMVGYVESSTNMNNDLVYLQSNANVAAARNAVGADLVALVVVSNTGGACGIGYLGPSASYAHSVTGRDCIVGNYTFAHEVGHNFGSHHAPEDGATGAWKLYGYGYKDTVAGFRTVMAYAPGTRILNFSNPAVGYGAGNRPTGSASQNNALSLSEAFPIVQGFRSVTLPPAAPGAPRNVVAGATGNTVQVSWLPPATGTATNYLAQVGTSPGASNVFSGAVGLITSASGVLPNGTYYIRIYAQNAAGTSPASPEASVAVGPVPPGAPQNLTGSVSGPLATVSWNPPAAGGPVTTYLAQVGTSPGGSNVFSGSVGPGTSGSGTLAPGTYYVRIYAQNAAGTSGPSNELVLTVGPSCTLPPAPALGGSKSGNTLLLTWTTPSGGPVNGYTVQAGAASGGSGFFNGPVGLVNAVSAQVPNGSYFVRVIANAACGNSPVSNEVQISIP
jgi:hypothetical protein